MKAYYSLFKIVFSHNKFNAIEYKPSNILNDNDIKQLLEYSYTLLNSDDFLKINGKLQKLTFFGLNNYYHLISIIPSGLNSQNEDIYTIRIMHINDNNFNPFNAFLTDYFIKENDNKEIILNTNKDSLINQQMLNTLNNKDELILATYIEALLRHDKPIMIYASDLIFYFALTGFILPFNNLYDISYTFGNILKNMTKFSLFGIAKERMITSENIYYIDFINNDYPLLELSRYSANLASLLLNSYDDSYNYVKKIEELMINHNISCNRAAMLYDFVNARIEAFTNPIDLSQAIKDSEYKYNNNYIASAIYSKLNKFRINNYMLEIYKYVYDYIESSRDEIIKLFFSNLNKFGINIKNKPKDYLNLIINNAPFDLSDYYDYLIKYDLFNAKYINGIENFNEWYILLDAICKNIQKNKKQIVPNELLIYYIKECVKLKNIDYLDLVLEEINKLNNKAPSRLLFFVFEQIDKEIDNYTMDFGIYYTFRIIERMNPKDALKFYEKSFNSVINRKEYVSLYIEREEKKKDYYNELNELLINDGYNQLINMKENIKIDKKNDFDIFYLDEIYNKYYLDKNRRDNIFTDKCIEYIKKSNNKLLESLNIYNRYYKNLDDNFKDKDTFIRKMMSIIYQNPDLIYENDLKCYNDLFEIDLYLQKRKENSLIYLDVLKSGLDIKKAYLDDKFRYKYFKDLIIKENKWFDEKGNELYNKYYLKYLLSSFYKFMPSFIDMKNPLLITKGFNNLFNNLKDYKGFNYSFVNTIINYDKNDFKLNYLLFLLFVTNNKDNVYELIRDEIEEKYKNIIKIYKEYYRVVKKIDAIKELVDNFNDYINSYLCDNLGIFRKIIWKLFKR